MGSKLSRSETEAMFYYWMQTNNFTEVARRFGHSRSTVKRAAHRDNWQLRREEINKEATAQADKKLAERIANSEISDFQITTELLQRAVDQIIDQNSQIKASYGDVIRLLAVRADMTGGSTGRTGVNIFQVLADGTLSSLTQEELGRRLETYSIFFREKIRLETEGVRLSTN